MCIMMKKLGNYEVNIQQELGIEDKNLLRNQLEHLASTQTDALHEVEGKMVLRESNSTHLVQQKHSPQCETGVQKKGISQGTLVLRIRGLESDVTKQSMSEKKKERKEKGKTTAESSQCNGNQRQREHTGNGRSLLEPQSPFPAIQLLQQGHTSSSFQNSSTNPGPSI